MLFYACLGWKNSVLGRKVINLRLKLLFMHQEYSPLLQLNSPFSRYTSVILFIGIVLLGECLTPSLIFSQGVSPAITPDGSLGTIITRNANLYDITGGTRPGDGSNLFHSFEKFNVNVGEVANFVNDAGLATENILSRVTGGDTSQILGTIQTSEFDSANLFLLNPAGILFGPNASLNVGGSFHVSTANSLQFEDGRTFYTDISLDGSTDSILRADLPEAFGFLSPPTTLSFSNETPAPITIDGSRLVIPDGETVSLTGGAIDIVAGAVTTSGGTIVLSSITSDDTVNIHTGELTQESVMPPSSSSNQITVSDGTRVDASGAPGGAIRIQGGRLVVDDSTLEVSTQGAGSGNGIVVDIDEDVVFTNQAELIADVSGPGNAGTIQVAAELVEVNQGSLIRSESSPDSSGRTASLGINAGTLRLIEGGQVISSTQGFGSGGAITISVEADMVMQGGRGAVDPRVSNPQSPIQSRISTATSFGSSGPGGTLTVTAGNLIMNAARLDAGGFGSGPGGDATVMISENLEIRNRSEIATTAALPGATGGSGTLTVAAQDILVVGIKDPTNAGGVDFTGFTSATADGPGGDFRLNARNLTMTDTGLISSATLGSGEGGDIDIQLAGKMDFSNGAAIVGSTFGVASGNAGSIKVTADEIVLSGNNPVPIPDGFIPNIVFLNVGSIVNSSLPGPGGGNAGDVEVNAKTISVQDGGRIDSRTFSSGNGGAVNVTADEIIISDVNPDIVDFFIEDGGTLDFSLDLARSTITTDSLDVFNKVEGNESNPALGKAGAITVRAKDLRIQDGGVISSRTTTPGSAGSIEVIADNIALVNNGQIVASNGLGFLGDSATATGDTGEVQITTENSFTLTDSEVRVDAVNGVVGNLSINVGQDLRLTDSSLITAESLGAGNAGEINLEAANSIILDGSTIKTVALQADGGDIKLTASDRIQLNDSIITSSVGGGVGGNINLDPDFIILNNSEVLAQAGEGQGGQIQLTANVVLADPFTNISASAGPAGIDGSVSLDAPIQNLSGTIAPLPEELIKVAQFYSSRCVAQKGGNLSSFVYHQVPALPIQPGDFMNSHVAWESLPRESLFSGAAPLFRMSRGDELPRNSAMQTQRFPFLGLSHDMQVC